MKRNVKRFRGIETLLFCSQNKSGKKKNVYDYSLEPHIISALGGSPVTC
jgi:hypothetical protein